MNQHPASVVRLNPAGSDRLRFGKRLNWPIDVVRPLRHNLHVRHYVVEFFLSQRIIGCEPTGPAQCGNALRKALIAEQAVRAHR